MCTSKMIPRKWHIYNRFELITFITYIHSRWDRLEVIDGILNRKFETTDTSKNRLQAIVPFAERRNVLFQCHDSKTSGHLIPIGANVSHHSSFITNVILPITAISTLFAWDTAQCVGIRMLVSRPVDN
jgi:hypothetical protein